MFGPFTYKRYGGQSKQGVQFALDGRVILVLVLRKGQWVEQGQSGPIHLACDQTTWNAGVPEHSCLHGTLAFTVLYCGS